MHQAVSAGWLAAGAAQELHAPDLPDSALVNVSHRDQVSDASIACASITDTQACAAHRHLGCHSCRVALSFAFSALGGAAAQSYCWNMFGHVLQVQELPQGAKQLASSDACAIAMYSVGSHILCIQGALLDCIMVPEP